MVVGISKYGRPADVKPLDFGAPDAQAIYTALVPLLRRENVTLLVDSELGPIETEISRRYRLLSSDDTLLLFFSAHGVTDQIPGWGGICVRCDFENPQLQSFSTTEMAKLFLRPRLHRGRVVLLLDVLRRPLKAGSPNINDRFEELAKIGERKIVGGLTATDNGPSGVNSSLGRFAGALVAWLSEANNPNVPKDWDKDANLLQFLEKRSGQTPRQLNKNKDYGQLLPLTRGISLGRTRVAPPLFVPAGFSFRRGWPSLPLFWFGAPNGESETNAIREAIRDNRLLGNGGAYAQLVSLDPTLQSPDPDLLTLREDLADALQTEGQSVLQWYASGNDFAFEPPEVLSRDFTKGWHSFRIAAELLEDTNQDYRVEELKAKGDFCAGRRLAFSADDWDSARSLLKKAARGLPDAAEPPNALGILDLEAGVADHGRAQFEKALAKSPAWSLARHNLALSYAESGNYQKAIREYRRALAVTPQHGYLWHNLGLIHQRQGHIDEARSSFQQALLRFADQEKAYSRFAQEHGTSATDRRRSLKRAVAARLNQSQTRNVLGILFASQNKSKRAKHEYQEALNLIPESDRDLLTAPETLSISPLKLPPAALQAATIEHNLALLYARSRQTEADALRIWEKLRKVDFAPADPSAAELYSRRADYAQAALIYQRLSEKQPSFRPRLAAVCTQLRNQKSGHRQGETTPCPIP